MIPRNSLGLLCGFTSFIALDSLLQSFSSNPKVNHRSISGMLAPQENRVMALKEWEDRWQEGRIGFHNAAVHKMLEMNIDKVVAGRTGVKFFFPLCGKAVDMKWLADMGHSVVGVEISEKAIRQFFEESNMSYTEESVAAVPEAKVFRNTEKTVSLYNCDMYKFSSSLEGQFGAIWDRGALVAINPKDREKYAALIVSLMAPDCRYLLDTLLYNPELYKGPPFFVPDEQVNSLFGSSCEIAQVQELDTMSEKAKNWGLDSLTEKLQMAVEVVVSCFMWPAVKEEEGVARDMTDLCVDFLQDPRIHTRCSMSVENQAGTLEEWEEHWQHGGFYVPTVTKMLSININKVLAGRATVRFFVPLCGKTVDMKWLAELGHSVVGVERSEKAVRQFFVESNMSYTEESVPAIPGAKVFKNAEKTVTLYQCDIYSFTSSLEGQFDAMWDRGALVVIDPKHRQKYVSLIVSLMAPGCRCLLDTLLYDPERYAGPPFLVTDEQIRSLFGSVCDVEPLQEEDALTEDWADCGLDSLTEKVHLLVHKS